MDLAEFTNLTLIDWEATTPVAHQPPCDKDMYSPTQWAPNQQAISRPEWDTVLKLITQPPNNSLDRNDSLEEDNSSVIWYFAHPDYENYSMASTAVYMCTHLGLLSVILNLFVVIALIRNHRRVLLNVFYVIVLHCAILDVVRGACLIIYGLPSLAQSIYRALGFALPISTNVTLFRASSFALVILRICNLLTIFNLLVFTTNEFIVIRYPLHYRRYFRRRAVLVILACCWLVSIVMGLGLLVPPMLMISVLCVLVLAIVMVCYGFILRTIRRFKEDSVLNSEDSHKHNSNSLRKTASNGSSANPGNKTRKFKLQTMQRHKYIYVIGTVLLVDLLFLCPYSGIQIVSFLHINGFLEITHSSTFIRWWLQVLIGVHSVCQPLCYFRMNEFRRLACCGGRRPWNRSKTFSQVNRSFGNTRSANREEEEAREDGPAEQPLLDATFASASPFESPARVARGGSVRFRTYGNQFAVSTGRDGCTNELSEQPDGVEMQPLRPAQES